MNVNNMLNLKMLEKFILCIVLSSLFLTNISAYEISTPCYFDGRYESVTNGQLTDDNYCIRINETKEKTSPSDTDDCGAPIEDMYQPFEPDRNPEKFNLSINLGNVTWLDKTTKERGLLNLTISNNNFHKLTVRLQNTTEREIIEETIELDKDNIPQQLSMFFSLWPYIGTKIQLLAEKNNHYYFKEYHCSTPGISELAYRGLKQNQIFAYVDTTLRHKIRLHIQPLPEKFNIQKYNVQFLKRTDLIEEFDLFNENLNYERNIFHEDGPHRFILTPIDINGTSHNRSFGTEFCIKKRDMLVIMVVSIFAVPVVIFFALYIMYIISKRRASKSFELKRPPNCLLVYSTTHDSHINVMINLANYLKGCRINPMLDVLDVPKETLKNPSQWCDGAFQKADIVIVVASPPAQNSSVVTKTIYRDLDNHAFNLIGENRRHRNKRYLTLYVPYYKMFDVHPVARAFKSLEIKKTKHLKKLVNQIHDGNYTELFDIPNEQKLMESIDLAERSIVLGESIANPRNPENLCDLICSVSKTAVVDVDPQDDSDEDSAAFICKSTEEPKIKYDTNIKDLNLLGDGASFINKM